VHVAIRTGNLSARSGFEAPEQEKTMSLVKSLASAAVLALFAIGPANACSYSKQDTSAEAPKPAEVAAAPAIVTPAPVPVEPTATTPAPAGTEVATATPVAPTTVKPN
jgi:hypothetical protein